jgi:hypothetical protein
VSRCVFYVAVIGGRQFDGILSGDGPYIACGNDGVALGMCASIEQLGAEIESGLRRRPVMPHRWWIAKYRTQPRISLDGMTDPERRRLADEFGIRVGRESRGARVKLLASAGTGRRGGPDTNPLRGLSRFPVVIGQAVSNFQ